MNEKKSNHLINGVIAAGVFAAAFYFLFLRGNKSAVQNQAGNNVSEDPVTYSNETVPSRYLTKKVFKGSSNPNIEVEGYEMPPSPNMLNWSSEKPIKVIVKPDTGVLWYSVKPLDEIELTRVSVDTVGYRSTPNNPNIKMRDYSKIMNEVVLINPTDFNT